MRSSKIIKKGRKGVREEKEEETMMKETREA